MRSLEKYQSINQLYSNFAQTFTFTLPYISKSIIEGFLSIDASVSIVQRGEGILVFSLIRAKQFIIDLFLLVFQVRFRNGLGKVKP